jgi:ABC-type molybdenum transport system ATPase subunit/photorepair protein PhrA
MNIQRNPPLKKVEIKDHPFLGSFTLDLTHKSGKAYTNILLVSENGLGKTTLLDILNDYNSTLYIDKKLTDELGSRIPVFSSILPYNIKYQQAANCINTIIDAVMGVKKSKKADEQYLDVTERINKMSGSFCNQKIINILRKMLEKRDASVVENFLKDIPKDFGIDKLVKTKTYENEITSISQLCSGEQEILLRLLILSQSERLIKDKMTGLTLIDEPEAGLHPKWQNNFIESLTELNRVMGAMQMIVATHSENILQAAIEIDLATQRRYPNTFAATNWLIIRLEKSGDKIVPVRVNDIANGTQRVLPMVSFAEIRYIIFDITSNDYHNELFGHLIDKEIKDCNGTVVKPCRCQSISCVDDTLNIIASQKGDTDIQVPTTGYLNMRGDKKFSAYIRNQIDHPEVNGVNRNAQIDQEKLKISTDFLRKVISNNLV